MSLHNLIKQCCETVRQELDEHDAEDVLRCLRRDHGADIELYANAHVDDLIRRLIKKELKREAGTEHTDNPSQMTIAGIDRIPQSLSFYDGQRVRFIATMKARADHFRSAIKLREDAAGYSAQMARKLRTLLDLIESHQDDGATLAEAVAKASPAASVSLTAPQRQPHA